MPVAGHRYCPGAARLRERCCSLGLAGCDHHGPKSHLALCVARWDHLGVEAADKEDARAIMLALMSADAKLDKIIYLLGEDDEEGRREEARAVRLLALAEQAPQHVLQDPAVLEVLALAWRVEPDARGELLVVRPHHDLACRASVDARDRELLAAR